MFQFGLICITILCAASFILLQRTKHTSGIVRICLLLATGILFLLTFSWSSVIFVSQKGTVAFEISRLPEHIYHLRGVKIQAEIHKLKYGPHHRQYIEYISYSDSIKKQKPAIFYVHGGGWTVGRPNQDYFLADMLAKMGHPVYLCAYRLAPKHNSIQLNSDVLSAYRAAFEHHTDSVLGSTQPALMPKWIIGGTSAGSNLAALLCYDNTRFEQIAKRDSILLGYFTMSGVLDLNVIVDNMVVRSYSGKRGSQLFNESNPLYFIDSSDHFPILAIHGAMDGLAPLENITNFTDSLSRLGISSNLHVIEGASHLETCTAWYYDPTFNAGQDSIIISWINTLSKSYQLD